MMLVLPFKFRVVVSLGILLTFLLCSGWSLFCPMAYASGGAVPHHSASHSNPLESDAGCPELAVASTAPFGDVKQVILPSIGLGVTSQHWGTPVFASILPDRRPPSSHYPLLFLLFSVFLN